MDQPTADQVSAQIRAAGYDHTRYITQNGDRIVLEQRRYDGADLLSLLTILVPAGQPLTGITVSLEAAGLVIT